MDDDLFSMGPFEAGKNLKWPSLQGIMKLVHIIVEILNLPGVLPEWTRERERET